MYILLPEETIASLNLSLLMMVICGALESAPSRIMIESPFIFKASNHSLTLLPSGKFITHLQLKDPWREKSWGDEVIIPCGSFNLHPQEHSDPETGNV